MGRKPCRDCAGAGNVSIFHRRQKVISRFQLEKHYNVLCLILFYNRKFVGYATDLVSVLGLIVVATALGEGETSMHSIFKSESNKRAM